MQIFPNGYMYYGYNSQPDLDADGNPVASSTRWRSARCTISSVSDDRKGRYSDGKYRNCSYSVTFDIDVVGTEFMSVRTVTLIHDIKGELGTFQIQRTEFYTITQTVEIWV